MSQSRALSNLSEETAWEKLPHTPTISFQTAVEGHPVLNQVLTFFLISPLPLLVSNLLPDWDIVPVPLPEGVPGGTGPPPPTHFHLYLPAAQIPDRGNT